MRSDLLVPGATTLYTSASFWQSDWRGRASSSQPHIVLPASRRGVPPGVGTNEGNEMANGIKDRLCCPLGAEITALRTTAWKRIEGNGRVTSQASVHYAARVPLVKAAP